MAERPRDYQRQKFTVATDLTIDMRHGALLNHEAYPECKGILFAVVPNTPAAAAYREIEDAMLGVTYFRRHTRRAPSVWLDLHGIRVRATGAMFCSSASEHDCQMHVTDLRDVAYPPSFPTEMRPR